MKKLIVVLIGICIGLLGFFVVKEALKEAENNPKETGNFLKLLIGACLVVGAGYLFFHQSSGTPGWEQEVREERAGGEEVTWQREAYLKRNGRI
jgi:H+/Cl- antiporter ClcA